MAGKKKRYKRAPHITDNSGKILKAEREAQHCTRDQLVERSGISDRYLVAIENEGQVPRVRVLSDLIRGLGISADLIFYPEHHKMQSDIDQIIRLSQTCSERDRRLIIALLKAMQCENEEIITDNVDTDDFQESQE